MSYVERAARNGPESNSLSDKPLKVRLLYALGVAVLGYFTFNALVLLAVIQFFYIAVNKSRNEEISHFSKDLLSYLGEVLAFILFLSDEPPFPFAPFPGTTRNPE